MTTPLINGTDFICVPVDDFDAGVAVLRRRPRPDPLLKQWGEMPGIEFETGNLTLAVMEPDRLRDGVPHPQLADRVPRRRRRRGARDLESRGVTFEGDTLDSGVCHQAFFKDPDGQLAGDPPPLRAALDAAPVPTTLSVLRARAGRVSSQWSVPATCRRRGSWPGRDGCGAGCAPHAARLSVTA